MESAVFRDESAQRNGAEGLGGVALIVIRFVGIERKKVEERVRGSNAPENDMQMPLMTVRN